MAGLEERNQQILSYISQLQTQETNLYNQLNDNSIPTDQKQKIIAKINELAQMRLNMYMSLKDQYSNWKQDLNNSQSTLSQQVDALDIIEAELNDRKRRLNALQNEKVNQLRMVQINTYYGKKYEAQSQVMITVILTFVPLLLLTVLYKKQLVPSSVFFGLLILVLFIGSLFFLSQVTDIARRDSVNYDTYDWVFDKSSAPAPSSDSGSQSDPWSDSSATTTCVGAACCTTGSTYDASLNICTINA